MEWYSKKGEFPPLYILRNYMKLVMQYCNENNLMEEQVSKIHNLNLPFSIEFIPMEFPNPSELVFFKSVNKENEKQQQ